MIASFESKGPSPVRYVLDANHSAEEARRAAWKLGISRPCWLSQRDSRLGWIGEQCRPAWPDLHAARHAWHAAQPVLLPGFVAAELPAHRHHIAEAADLMAAVLDGTDCEQLLLEEPYAGRLAHRFELLSSLYDEGDQQEIVKLEFDAVRGDEIVAENLWVKLSWLSYAEQDASLRFRFSFGLENYEDVAADPERQLQAAALTEAIFPESAIISANSRLQHYLRELLEAKELVYVERIVYFNAPEGGAQFHHDVERGHLGVVFAQISGHTAWLALSTEQLLDALQTFLALPDAAQAMANGVKARRDRTALVALAGHRGALAECMNNRDHDALEQLINRTPDFARHLIERGHAYILHPGDIILLPQHDPAHCSWHAVYCLDDKPGEALSFAVRRAAP
ncbi:MAG: hypothetical protein P8164_05215 [Gammaproteobacteria bacterium]|jgi:hypothetical protein